MKPVCAFRIPALWLELREAQAFGRLRQTSAPEHEGGNLLCLHHFSDMRVADETRLHSISDISSCLLPNKWPALHVNVFHFLINW